MRLTMHREREVARTQLISDLCDLTIPLSMLGWVPLSDGVVGFAGSVGSLIGLTQVWAKSA